MMESNNKTTRGKCEKSVSSKNLTSDSNTCPRQATKSTPPTKKKRIDHPGSSRIVQDVIGPTDDSSVNTIKFREDISPMKSKGRGKIKQMCEQCGKVVYSRNLLRHLKTCAGVRLNTLQPQEPCEFCRKNVTLSNKARHIKKCKFASAYTQTEGNENQRVLPTSSSHSSGSVSNTIRSSLLSLGSNDTKETPKDELDIEEIETAFKCRMKTYVIKNTPGFKDPLRFLQLSRHLLGDKVKENLQNYNIKINIVLLAEFKKPSTNKDISQEMNFKTKNIIMYPTDDILKKLQKKEEKILKEMEEFQNKGSGWTLSKILDLELRINRYVPLRGSSYINLPEPIKQKKAVLNIKNNDQKCFLWSVLAALHPVDRANNPDRICKYKEYEHELDSVLQGIEFPVTLSNVKLFEKRSGISVNVYSYDEKFVVYPLLTTDEEKERHVDLLYVKNENNSHYSLINNLSRLVTSQKTKHEHVTHLCKRCLLHFGTESLLKSHKMYCKQHEPVKIVMPKEGETIKFKDHNRSMRVPFTIYADFECLLTPVTSEMRETTGPYTKKYQRHEAVSFSYYIVQVENDYTSPVTYFGTDAAQVFVNSILRESRKISYLYSKPAAKLMEMSDEDYLTISSATKCHICGAKFTKEDPLVRDHDHLTGKFRGPAHNSCNLNYKKPHFIPIFIHNLSGYDTHLFIKMFGLNNDTIDVIPNNEENYISYTVHVKGGVDLRFLDSMKFMSSSLEVLIKNLSPSQFKHTSKHYSGEQLQLLLRKGVYPYDFMDYPEKFELTSLPTKNEFHNTLTNSEINDEEYDHASKVWDVFNIQNMKEYTLLYNKSDVLQLADVMENFRDLCMKTYQLDPAWYYTAPGLAWSAMLKTTEVELELITDYNMILMIGNGIRGGLSQCSNRYAAANNKYMMENYDKDLPTSYLTYLDANNLYAWAMSQNMPYSNFKWVEEAKDIDVLSVPDDSDVGYILEVDLEYPKELHDLHSDLPLAPERKVPPGAKEEKLLTTLLDKKGYVVHYRNLKQYISLGLKLKRIHRAICFNQKSWLKPYIDLNTNMRTRAANNFEKDFFKLMNNSVFGKTMENIRNRVDIRLATQEKQVDKWLAQPNFKRRTIFTEQLAAVHMSKTKLYFNKAIYVGMSILDVSKTLMYDFHYNVIKARYKDKAKLQYTDTDSLTYHIETEDFYSDMKEMIYYFDTSDYPPTHPCYCTTNKKVVGKFKDELNGKIMYEHVGLRSKMYASRSEDDHLIKKSKGIKKSVVEKCITFQDYKDCLKTQLDQYRSMNMIRSYKHDLHSVELNKIALSAHDDKRYILSDGIETLPWGHYKIPQEYIVELKEHKAHSLE